jgi:hypothetical protein
MWNGLIDNDPSGQILSAWIAKEVHPVPPPGHRLLRATSPSSSESRLSTTGPVATGPELAGLAEWTSMPSSTGRLGRAAMSGRQPRASGCVNLS